MTSHAPMTRDSLQPQEQRADSYPGQRGTIIIQQPKSNLLGKLGMGLFCSTIVTIVMYFMQLRMFIIHILAFIVSMFGGTHYDVKTRTGSGPSQAISTGKTLLAKALHQAEQKGKEAAKAAARPVKSVIQKAERKVEQAERAVVSARDDFLSKLEERKAAIGKARAEVEAAEKQRLLARAAGLGVMAGDDRTVPELRQAIADAEHQHLLAQWSARYNGSCPNPRCRQPLRVSTRGRDAAQCPRCGFIASHARFRRWPRPCPGISGGSDQGRGQQVPCHLSSGVTHELVLYGFAGGDAAHGDELWLHRSLLVFSPAPSRVPPYSASAWGRSGSRRNSSPPRS